MPFKKWILVLLAALVLFSGCLAQSRNFKSNDPDDGKITLQGLKFYTNLTPALEAAKAQGKPVFVYARSEYCGACRQFEEESFTNQSIITTLNENFILASIDVDVQKTETRNLRLRVTPTEIFLDSNGTELKRMLGYRDNGTFLNTINDIAK
jgi:thioredoxin-related protein